jgi:hypothetical protein
MIQPVTKLVQITPVSPQEAAQFDLSTADGRFQIADRLLRDINEWCKKAFDDGPRTHLGASIIAAECDRHIWYSWRWFKHKIFSGTMQRLFQDGHWYEERFIEMLRGIGCTVTQVDDDGGQIRIYDVQGHFGGSTDGSTFLPPSYNLPVNFLLEFKTANDKWFTKFHDVAESKPQHWGQMCVYGYKRGIKYGIYFIVNKNDSDLKIEVVELDWAYAKQLIDKGEWIIYSPVPPAKLSDNPSDWRCKMCDHHSVCHMGVEPDVNCRTCRHSSAIDNKQWKCNRWNILIPGQVEALSACTGYERLVV